MLFMAKERLSEAERELTPKKQVPITDYMSKAPPSEKKRPTYDSDEEHTPKLVQRTLTGAPLSSAKQRKETGLRCDIYIFLLKSFESLFSLWFAFLSCFRQWVTVSTSADVRKQEREEPTVDDVTKAWRNSHTQKKIHGAEANYVPKRKPVYMCKLKVHDGGGIIIFSDSKIHL